MPGITHSGGHIRGYQPLFFDPTYHFNGPPHMDYLALLQLPNTVEDWAVQLHKWKRHCGLEDEIRGFNQELQITSPAYRNAGKFGL